MTKNVWKNIHVSKTINGELLLFLISLKVGNKIFKTDHFLPPLNEGSFSSPVTVGLLISMHGVSPSGFYIDFYWPIVFLYGSWSSPRCRVSLSLLAAFSVFYRRRLSGN